jgi:hypothetical protein
MNKKIIGILICMLLIATAVPAVGSLKNSAINLTVPSTPLTSMTGWIGKQKLLALDRLLGVGWSVSLNGDTALIGAYGENSRKGSAYVFARTGTTWIQQAKLLTSDGTAENYFGWSVSLSGDTALIGALLGGHNGVGSVYVFARTGTTWTQQAKLLASDGSADEQFGYSVSLSGDTALIGTPYDVDNGVDSGSAYVFTRTGTSWTQQAKLLAPDGAEYDFFGGSVSLSGDTALIGAMNDDDNGNYSGSAYVFTRTGTTWTQQQKLLASRRDGDQFGVSVSLSGDTALIGASWNDDNGYSGSMYVFTRTGTTWTQQQKLFASDGAAGDQFGVSVSLSGDTALIGAYLDDDNGAGSGSAYVFTRTGTTWTQQQKLLASDGAAGDCFGWSVSLAGDTTFIGAPLDFVERFFLGSAYVFTRTGTTWTEQTRLRSLSGTSGIGGTFAGNLSYSPNGKKVGEISGSFPTKNKFQGNWNVSTNPGTVQFIFGRYYLIGTIRTHGRTTLITGFYTFNETAKTFAGKLQPAYIIIYGQPIYFQGICT